MDKDREFRRAYKQLYKTIVQFVWVYNKALYAEVFRDPCLVLDPVVKVNATFVELMATHFTLACVTSLRTITQSLLNT